MARKPIQHNVEDKTFAALIRKYAKARDLEMVQALMKDYGRILEDREEELKQQLEVERQEKIAKMVDMIEAEALAGGGRLEATCLECQEIFIPEDEEDLVHLQREDGTPCGGMGEITREYFFPRSKR